MILIFGVCQILWSQNQVSSASQLLSDSQVQDLSSLSGQQADRTAQALLTWALLVNGQHQNVGQAMNFLQNHPDWPLQRRMRKAIEKNLSKNHSAPVIIDWFSKYPPASGRGLLYYLKALSATGQKENFQGALVESWPTLSMSLATQTVILTQFNSLIPRELHQQRLNMLLHAGKHHEALEVAVFLGKGYSNLARARLALQAGDPQVNERIDKIPRQLLDDPGLRYERLHWRRSRDLNEGMKKLLARSPAYQDMFNPQAWWRERHILIRRLIEHKAYDAAYDLAASHRQKEGLSYLQAEWLSGFIALRLLNRPLEAFSHFKNLYQAATTAISQARGAYWAGRAAQARHQPKAAQRWLRRAAAYQHTYYGQAARSQLGQALRLKETQIKARPPEKKHRDLMRAFEILASKNIDYPAELFVSQLISLYEDQPETLIYLARWMDEKGHIVNSVRLAKILARQNIMLWKVGYPVLPEVIHAQSSGSIDPALTHALIRQESLFNPAALSPAGAMGLMQVMPRTAAQVAKRLGLAHERSWLRTRAAHNVTIGQAYFSRRMAQFDGHLPISLAAYNAGQGRVGRWLQEEIGDPRLGGVNSEDWIELIPIYETRNYVQRIIEAKRIYQSRFQ